MRIQLLIWTFEDITIETLKRSSTIRIVGSGIGLVMVITTRSGSSSRTFVGHMVESRAWTHAAHYE